MTRIVNRFEALCGLSLVVMIVAVFVFAGTCDVASLSGKDADPSAYWALFVAAFFGGLALWFNHQAHQATHRLQRRDELARHNMRVENFFAYTRGEKTGF